MYLCKFRPRSVTRILKLRNFFGTIKPEGETKLEELDNPVSVNLYLHSLNLDGGISNANEGSFLEQ